MPAKSLQSCPTLYNPMDYRSSGASIHEDSLGKNTGGDCRAMPCPGDLPDPGIEPVSFTSPALADRYFTTSTWEAPIFPWKLYQIITCLDHSDLSSIFILYCVSKCVFCVVLIKTIWNNFVCLLTCFFLYLHKNMCIYTFCFFLLQWQGQLLAIKPITVEIK